MPNFLKLKTRRDIEAYQRQLKAEIEQHHEHNRNLERQFHAEFTK